ncbi:MAG: acyl-CoA dehydrogenase family protein [Amphiplicatus sp.]
MDLSFSEEDEQFRLKVRTFLRENLPNELAEAQRSGFHLDRHTEHAWLRILYDKGWAAPDWPKEYGGTGWDATRQYIFFDEIGAADAPYVMAFGRALSGPLIYTFGNDEQKAKYLEPILRGDTFWCEGFSEPDSGSDLASIKTRAERDGAYYVVNGQKIWTTNAHSADMIFCLLRTSKMEKPQRGLSFLLIDLRLPGVNIRPIVSIDGEHHLNEVFLENVRVPVSERVGEEGAGWEQTKFLLRHSRTSSAMVEVVKQEMRQLIHLTDGSFAGSAPAMRRRLTRLRIDVEALEWMILRVLVTDELQMIDSAVIKMLGMRILQEITELKIDLLGVHAIPKFGNSDDRKRLASRAPSYAAGAMVRHLYRRALTIAGGTTEIQRTIIARQRFGL